MTTVAFGKSDFTAPPMEPANHWCVCSGKVVIGGLFETKTEALEFARQAMNTHAHLSIHHVGAEVPTWKPMETAPMDENVLLWNGDDVIQGRYLGTYCMETSFEGSTMVCVTHWMPLPEPPKS